MLNRSRLFIDISLYFNVLNNTFIIIFFVPDIISYLIRRMSFNFTRGKKFISPRVDSSFRIHGVCVNCVNVLSDLI